MFWPMSVIHWLQLCIPFRSLMGNSCCFYICYCGSNIMCTFFFVFFRKTKATPCPQTVLQERNKHPKCSSRFILRTCNLKHWHLLFVLRQNWFSVKIQCSPWLNIKASAISGYTTLFFIWRLNPWKILLCVIFYKLYRQCHFFCKICIYLIYKSLTWNNR